MLLSLYHARGSHVRCQMIPEMIPPWCPLSPSETSETLGMRIINQGVLFVSFSLIFTMSMSMNMYQSILDRGLFPYSQLSPPFIAFFENI